MGGCGQEALAHAIDKDQAFVRLQGLFQFSLQLDGALVDLLFQDRLLLLERSLELHALQGQRGLSGEDREQFEFVRGYVLFRALDREQRHTLHFL